MAEALINHLGEGHIQAFSAGSHPAGYIHPKSLETLQRHGIAFQNSRSKSWDEFTDQPLDVVITVCDEAASESCPNFTGDYQKLHWSTPDPAGAQGSEDEIDQAFDAAYQILRERIEKELL